MSSLNNSLGTGQLPVKERNAYCHISREEWSHTTGCWGRDTVRGVTKQFLKYGLYPNSPHSVYLWLKVISALSAQTNAWAIILAYFFIYCQKAGFWEWELASHVCLKFLALHTSFTNNRDQLSILVCLSRGFKSISWVLKLDFIIH